MPLAAKDRTVRGARLHSVSSNEGTTMTVLGQHDGTRDTGRDLRWALVALVVLAAWEVAQVSAAYLMLTVIAPNYPPTPMAGDFPLDRLAVFVVRPVLALVIAAVLALPAAKLILRRQVPFTAGTRR
jgi:hypothetical protein